MKIGFIINDIASEKANYTTINLALACHRAGHNPYIIPVGDLAYYSDGQMGAHAYAPKKKRYQGTKTFLEDIRSSEQEVIKATDLDVLMLRNNPSEDIDNRPWAMNAGVVFGQVAAGQGVIVLNDPFSLSNAMNKIYLQYFPEAVRPKTIITRNQNDIKEFFKEMNYKMVLKPLQGSGGRNVFVVTKEQAKNINQMIEAISRDGYVIAQEYLPKAKEGDTRVFLMEGNPVYVGDKLAAVHRIPSQDDSRSNVSAGGTIRKVEMNPDIERLIQLVRPKLLIDGMFLAGLDVVGDKIMEINVFSPGGMNAAGEMLDVDFFPVVVKAIEKKYEYKCAYGKAIQNSRIASM